MKTRISRHNREWHNCAALWMNLLISLSFFSPQKKYTKKTNPKMSLPLTITLACLLRTIKKIDEIHFSKLPETAESETSQNLRKTTSFSSLTSSQFCSQVWMPKCACCWTYDFCFKSSRRDAKFTPHRRLQRAVCVGEKFSQKLFCWLLRRRSSSVLIWFTFCLYPKKIVIENLTETVIRRRQPRMESARSRPTRTCPTTCSTVISVPSTCGTRPRSKTTWKDELIR